MGGDFLAASLLVPIGLLIVLVVRNAWAFFIYLSALFRILPSEHFLYKTLLGSTPITLTLMIGLAGAIAHKLLAWSIRQAVNNEDLEGKK
jgi:small-conductance mechanosensitive channel